MDKMCGKIQTSFRNSERGEGTLKLIIFLVVIFLVGWAGYNFIPVKYNESVLRQEMDTTVTQAMVSPNALKNQVRWTEDQVKKLGPNFDLPEDTLYEVKQGKNGGVSVTIKFKKTIALLPFYNYNYEFDYTAKTSSFMLN